MEDHTNWSIRCSELSSMCPCVCATLLSSCFAFPTTGLFDLFFLPFLTCHFQDVSCNFFKIQQIEGCWGRLTGVLSGCWVHRGDNWATSCRQARSRISFGQAVAASGCVLSFQDRHGTNHWCHPQRWYCSLCKSFMLGNHPVQSFSPWH